MAVPRIGLGAILPPVPTDQPRSMGGPGTGGITGLVGPGGQVLPPPPAPTRPPATTADGQVLNAQALLRSFLDSIGLGSLYDRAQTWIAGGFNADYVLEQLRQTPEYQQRFPGMAARQAAGLPAISEGEYIGYETATRQLMMEAGLPPDFYDQPTDFANFIGRDISVDELRSRIHDGYAAAMAAPAEVRSELANLYGITTGGLASYYLDPQRSLPALQKQLTAATESGAAVRSGFGSLSQTEAERLADLGVTSTDAQSGFGQLVRSRELFSALPGEQGAPDITRQQQLNAAFGGSAVDEETLRRRAAARASVFSAGGGYTAGQRGVLGAGAAPT